MKPQSSLLVKAMVSSMLFLKALWKGDKRGFLATFA